MRPSVTRLLRLLLPALPLAGCGDDRAPAVPTRTLLLTGFGPFAQVPLARLGSALRSEGFEVVDSEDAGGYLCNHLFDEWMTRRPDGGARFVHVPTMAPPWDQPRLRRAVRRIIETLGGT